MGRRLSISEAKAGFADLVTAVEKREQDVVITRKGKPVAVLVNYEYMRELETIDVLTDPELMRQIRASQASEAAGEKSFSFEEVFGEPLAPRRKKPR